MACFVIAGHPDCNKFAHAVHVAKYLKSCLPHFDFEKIAMKNDSVWREWLSELNKKNEWYLTESPVIWKEINKRGYKKYLIGGLSEFWEYCFDYYGLESYLTMKDTARLVQDNMRFYRKEEEAAALENIMNTVSIIHASNISTFFFIEDLFKVNGLATKNGLEIRLFDYNLKLSTIRRELQELANYINSASFCGSKQLVTVVYSLADCIKDCDVLLYLYDQEKYKNVDHIVTLAKNYARMSQLAQEINLRGKRGLRVIFCSSDENCFNATYLASMVLTIKRSNIVVITADEGLSMLNVLSEATQIPIAHMCGPPVWGFLNEKMYIDQRCIITKVEVFRPYQRSLRAQKSATLPLGKVVTELRSLSYKIEKTVKFRNMLDERKRIKEELYKSRNAMAKARCLVSLLKIWYGKDTEKIVSLGIFSNGAYDIPRGVVFSQPAHLSEKNTWVPYEGYPISELSIDRIKNVIKETKDVLEKFEKVKENKTFV